MIVFLDTEFTDLLNPQLLSLGMVTFDGSEHYSELDLTTPHGAQRHKDASAFVQAAVLTQWGRIPGAQATELDVGRRAGEWLLELARDGQHRIEVAYDYSMDYELMEYAIRDAGLWDQVREIIMPANIKRMIGCIEGELASEECFRDLSMRGLHRHHALADAIALRAAYMRMKDIAMKTS